MCGIAGFVDRSLAGPDERSVRLGTMLSRIAHRGPDDEGIWVDGPVAIGHRRLSIVDLSALGHQPMSSASGRYMIAFNGEIYNHSALRDGLIRDGVQFHSHSDTEVLLALIERRGLAEALRRCIGMFAIVLWDRRERVMQFARDRFGEKPLYYGWFSNILLFGSELKALMAHPMFSSDVDANTVQSILERGFAKAPRSIFRSVRQVPPGSLVRFAFQGPFFGPEHAICERYWHPGGSEGAIEPRPTFHGSFEDATTELQRLLHDAVSLQMQADVPFGALLSGGVDSSTVAGLMQAQSGSTVRTYSIGFGDSKLDETMYAKAVADRLGTRHTEWRLQEADALAMVPRLADLYDDPLADASQIPTVLLAQLVRRDVTVALSGDGADEIFGGYPKYQLGERLMRMRARRAIGRAAGLASNYVTQPLGRLLPASLSRLVPWHRVAAVHGVYGAASGASLARTLSALNRSAYEYMAPSLRSLCVAEPEIEADTGEGYSRAAMLIDMLEYLPGDILVKVDRATMAASLESRSPFLDHRIHEFAATLPAPYLFDERGGKSVLRAVLSRLMPRELVDRPKAGFVPPLGTWLRGTLREWAYDVLQSAVAARVVDVEGCTKLLDLHCRSSYDMSARLWPMLTLAAWSQRWIEA